MTNQSFVLCVCNTDSPASLELRKIYRTVEDTAAAEEGLIRVVDESGEDYLYPAVFFVPIEVPEAAEPIFFAQTS